MKGAKKMPRGCYKRKPRVGTGLVGEGLNDLLVQEQKEVDKQEAQELASKLCCCFQEKIQAVKNSAHYENDLHAIQAKHSNLYYLGLLKELCWKMGLNI